MGDSDRGGPQRLPRSSRLTTGKNLCLHEFSPRIRMFTTVRRQGLERPLLPCRDRWPPLPTHRLPRGSLTGSNLIPPDRTSVGERPGLQKIRKEAGGLPDSSNRSRSSPTKGPRKRKASALTDSSSGWKFILKILRVLRRDRWASPFSTLWAKWLKIGSNLPTMLTRARMATPC